LGNPEDPPSFPYHYRKGEPATFFRPAECAFPAAFFPRQGQSVCPFPRPDERLHDFLSRREAVARFLGPGTERFFPSAVRRKEAPDFSVPRRGKPRSSSVPGMRLFFISGYSSSHAPKSSPHFRFCVPSPFPIPTSTPPLDLLSLVHSTYGTKIPMLTFPLNRILGKTADTVLHPWFSPTFFSCSYPLTPPLPDVRPCYFFGIPSSPPPTLPSFFFSSVHFSPP